MNVTWMVPETHSTWKPKPKNWRKRYWYRPMNGSALSARTFVHLDEELKWRKVRAEQYVIWLAQRHGISREEAKERLDNQRPCELLEAIAAKGESAARSVEWLSPHICIRTVKAWAGGKHYGTHVQYSGAAYTDWFSCPKGEGQTTYRVIVDGRMVDSFLTKARAMAKARTFLSESTP